MTLSLNASLQEKIASLPTDFRTELIAALSDCEVDEALYAWRGHKARSNQLRPGTPGASDPRTDWRYWLVQAGRGGGKTRCGAETVREWVNEGHKLIHLVGPTAADVRDVMIQGPGGLLACYPPDERPLYEPSKQHRITWANGALAHAFSAEEPERLRGPQCAKAWCVARDTLIETEFGPAPIQNISVGHRVWTRAGLRPVLRAGLTNLSARLLRVSTEHESLRVTPEHKIYANGVFSGCSNVRPGDTIGAWKNSQSVLRGGLNGKHSAGIGPSQAITRTELAAFCMWLFGSERTDGLSLLDMTFIMSMKTPLTTNYPTSNAFHMASTSGSTTYEALGDSLLRRASGIERTGSSVGRSGSPSRLRAEDAGPSTSLLECERDSAQQIVELGSIVKSVEPDGSGPVYDLTVEGASEFFAGGLLVHNCDEIAAWKYGIETFDNLSFGLRMGDDPQAICTSTPRPVALFRQLVAHPKTVITRWSTYENRSNLAPGFFDDIIKKYEGTRLGRQELMAELLEDIPGALWTRAMIDRTRTTLDKVPQLIRAVVAIDPAVTANEGSDETGIVCVGLGIDQRLYVLDDVSLRGSPNEWARAACKLFLKWPADRIVAEVNNGGDLVEMNLRSIHPLIPFRAVRASRGKMTRAEPVASLYEQDRVSHVGTFTTMEDQMVMWVPGVTETSPDRMDALVWAIYDLVIAPEENRTLTAAPRVSISQY